MRIDKDNYRLCYSEEPDGTFWFCLGIFKTPDKSHANLAGFYGSNTGDEPTLTSENQVLAWAKSKLESEKLS